VHLHNSTLYVNGQPVIEKYVQYLPAGTDPYRDEFPASVYSDDGVDPAWWIQMHSLVKDGEITVPPGKLFVMGDNRNRSLDSRYWGFVPRGNVVGRPLLIYFSLNRPEEPQGARDGTSGGGSGAGSAGSAAQNVRMSHSHGIARWFSFARWGRMFRIVR
jgi:signal peptidase I